MVRFYPARFKVTDQAYLALVPGVRYRLYYLPYSHQLLSIEPVL